MTLDEDIAAAEAAVAAAEQAAIDARSARDSLYLRRSTERYGISAGMRVRVKNEPWLTGRKFKNNGDPGGGRRRLYSDWEIVAG